MMPKWIREFPFANKIEHVYYDLLFIAVWGLIAVIVGLTRDNVIITLTGAGLTFPYLIFVFLLWRSYHDDGYSR